MANHVHDAVMAYFQTLDAEADHAADFIALFDEQARFEDPVGGPVMMGHEGLAKFHKGLTRAWKQLKLEPNQLHVRGNQAAVSWNAAGHSATGKDITFDGINLVEVNDAGLIVSMSGYWDLEAVIAQM